MAPRARFLSWSPQGPLQENASMESQPQPTPANGKEGAGDAERTKSAFSSGASNSLDRNRVRALHEGEPAPCARAPASAPETNPWREQALISDPTPARSGAACAAPAGGPHTPAAGAPVQLVGREPRPRRPRRRRTECGCQRELQDPQGGGQGARGGLKRPLPPLNPP